MLMTGFKKKSIYRWEKKAAKWMKGHLIFTVILLIAGTLMLKGVVGAIRVGQPFSVTQIITHAITDGVKTDGMGHTNILLLGVGGEGHEGSTLTDTMIVASIDHRDGNVSMLSIPRDLYVENDVVGWGTRLNGVYEFAYENVGSYDEAMDVTREQIEEIVGVDIHYYAMVDFSGFEDIVDAVGGVEITLEGNFYDPYFPAENATDEYPYEPFFLQAGTQTLTGEEALKYARSRKTSSDFDRSQRQQEILHAIKDKASKAGFFLNPSKIKNTYNAVQENFETDLNITEILSLAQLAQDFDDNAIQSHVITDEAYLPGGFLYTPEREYYEGQFVLVPFTHDWSEIQSYAELIFYHHELYSDPVTIQVLNGTKQESMAGLTKMYLTRYGFTVSAYGNAASKEVDETHIFRSDPLVDATESENVTMGLLNELIPMLEIADETPLDYQPVNWTKKADLILELGEDFAEFYRENDEKFYIGFY